MDEFDFKRLSDMKPGAIVWVDKVPEFITYRYPLRTDVLVPLALPRDLTAAECKRLCAFIETLVVPPAPSAFVSSNVTGDSK